MCSESALALGSRGSLFEALEVPHYLNHAAVSPHSRWVREAVTAAMAAYAARGSSAFPDVVSKREALRARLGALLGADAREIAFVPNTTAGVITIAQSIPWQRGDRVALFVGEFPANTTPWREAARRFDLELVWLPLADFERSPEEGLARLDAELERGLRLVAVSAVQFRSGLRMPLAEMSERCHANEAELFVDGIQGLGSTPLDVSEGFDYFAAGGHKWLMGVEGAGLLYVRRERQRGLEPNLAGWLGHERAFDFLLRGEGHLDYDAPFRDDAAAFEPGTLNLLGYEALGAGIRPIEAFGAATIHEHVQTILDPLEAGLIERGFGSLRAVDPASRSSILSLEPPEDIEPVALHRALVARGVVTGLPDGALRFSPHFHNDAAEVPDILAHVDEALAEQS